MQNAVQLEGTRRPSRTDREGQRGFALLLVFAMAAAVAITLYMQLPRVAFEAQRDREEILIQRGEEYKRAIELYVRKNNRYPQRLEDLERQQDVRYLRRRYKDPLTGDDEWRLIHINGAGQLEDSLVKKKKTEGEPEDALAAGELSDENVAENTALSRQRSGDQLAASAAFPGSGNETVGSAAEGQQQPPPVNPLDEGLVPLLDASGNVVDRTKTEAEAQAQQQGLVAGQSVAGNPANAGQPPEPGAATQQARLGPGGIPIIEDPGAALAQAQDPQATPTPGGPPIAGAPSRGPSGQQSGQQGGQPGGQQSAQQLLQGLLTRPVPGGLQGLQQRRGIPPAGAASQGLGAGIAGVASKFEMRGIKVYDEQESIHKWEFVFDARASSAAGATATGARAPQGQQGPGGGFGFGGGAGAGPGRNGGGRAPAGQGPASSPNGPSFGLPPSGGLGAQPRRPR